MDKKQFIAALERQYLNILDPACIKKGYRILNKDLIQEIILDENGITAYVESESNDWDEYEISIYFTKASLLYCSCTCPVERNCKHCAAVCLALIYQDSLVQQGGVKLRTEFRSLNDFYRYEAQRLIEQAPEQSPVQQPAVEQRSIFIPQGKSRSISLLPNLNSAVPAAKDVERWQRAYWIHPSGSEGGIHGRVYYDITRILTWKRLDGSSGNKKKYSPSYNKVPVLPGAEALDALFEDTGYDSIALPLGAALLEKLPSDALYYSESTDIRDAESIKIIEAHTGLVSFKPLRMSTDEQSILYEVRLSFYEDSSPDSNGNGAVSLGPPIQWTQLCPLFMLYATRERLYKGTGPVFASRELGRLLGYDTRYTLEVDHRDLPELSKKLQALDPEGKNLRIQAVPERIERVIQKPELTVIISNEIPDQKMKFGCRFEFNFSYNGMQRTDSHYTGLIHLNENVLELYETDEQFEQKAISYFARIGREYIDRIVMEDSLTIYMRLGLHDFFASLFPVYLQQGYRFAVNLGSGPRKIGKAKVYAQISSGIDWFSTELRLDVDDQGMPLDNSYVFLSPQLLSHKGNLYLLENSDSTILQALKSSWDEETQSFRLDPRDLSSIALLEPVTDAEHSDENFKERAELLRKILSVDKTPEQALPIRLKAKLRPYQNIGYQWLLCLLKAGLGALLADDMGLGKTLQALAAMLHLKEQGLVSRVLIIAPLTVLGNWEEEIRKWTKGISVHVHYGSGRSRDQETLTTVLDTADIIISTYHTLRRDIELFAKQKLDMLILDEAQIMKNPKTAVSKALRRLEADYRLILTGTPMENRPLDLWTHFDLMNPGLLGTMKEFVSRYEKPIAAGDYERSRQLRAKTAPFILRRKKEDVLKELPPKEEINYMVELGGRQRAFYEALREQCAREIQERIMQEGLHAVSFYILEALLRLRQAAIHPMLIDEKYKQYGSGKLDTLYFLTDKLREEGHKILIFSQFTQALAIVRKHFDEQGIRYAYLDGQTRNRDAIIRQFEQSNSCTAFLLSLKAGGVGINLVSADYVILLDPWWNPAVESQAIDRAHRIGQKRTVSVYRLVAKSSIEEKILRLQAKKRKMIEELVTENKESFAGFTKEELIGLFL